jgi:3-hydroxyisobutyrate dehydrogenase
MSDAANGSSEKPSRIAFIGLGVMGAPMAGHLKNAGHKLTVLNRTREKAERWIAECGGEIANTPAEAASDADFVITCLANDEDVQQVYLGDNGVLSTAKPGTRLVDHTTASASIAREVANAAEAKGMPFFDAPLSGGQFGAQKGTLSILVGGDAESFPDVERILAAYASAAFHMGPAGAGQITKMVNQILIAGIFQSLSEGLNFAVRSGLEMDHAIEVLKKCTGHSWQMDHRAENMVKGKFDYGFAVNLIHKDLELCLDEAAGNGANLPVTSVIRERYAHLIDQGDGKLDATSLIKLL